MCVTCIIKLNICYENSHNTSHKLYWRARNARISPASSTTTRTVSQQDLSLSSTASDTNDEMPVAVPKRTESPPLLDTLYWTSHANIDTESGGTFNNVHAKMSFSRKRQQAQKCPFCEKTYKRAQPYLHRHIRKFHSSTVRQKYAARTKRSKSMNDLPTNVHQPNAEVISCPGCGKVCAPYEVFHQFTCKRVVEKNQQQQKMNVQMPCRRLTRSMSRTSLAAPTQVEDDVVSAISLPTAVQIPATPGRRRNSTKIK